MGIKYFFGFMKKHFGHFMYKMPKKTTVPDLEISIDNLMIDMNGVFHNSAQKVYEYGNFKPSQRIMGKSCNRRNQVGGLKKQLELFAHVCKTIEDMVDLVQPKKRLVLCVDGPAPLAKQQQQRGRRFRSAKETGKDAPFETSQITPGTKFMNYLSKYIDWYIRKRVSEDKKWQNLDVIFSNELAPGEGEQKLISWIRFHGSSSESYCINGLDADIIMLALATHMPNFYILREDLYDHKNEYHMIDIGSIRGELSDLLYWESDNKKHVFDERTAIDDFIAMGFLVGNDFLPHVPSIEIIEEGIELMINVYQQTCESYGHLTSHASGRVLLRPKVLKIFFGTLGFNEKENFENKLRKKNFHPDHLLLSCSKQDTNGNWEVDMKKYTEVYHKERFPEGIDIKKICHDYFEGIQWVLSYYTRGVPNWKWMFPYHYAPSASIMAQHVETFKMPQYGRTQPTTPFQQLLCVLPPKCSYLIPKPLDTLLTSETSPLREYCPEDFKIDLAGVGKGREWAGIVILPMIDFKVMLKSYFANVTKVDKSDLKRNVHGRSFIYRYDPNYINPFRSYYGDIPVCKVRTVIFDL